MTRTAIKFGLFVALCMAFLLYLATTIGNTTLGGLVGRGPGTYTLVATFDDVSGLLIDDNVKIAGVPVGKVTGIGTEDGRAVVTMEIRDRHPVPEDSAASIRWRNLIGQRFIYLEPGDSSVAMADGTRIEDTTNVIDLGELFNRLGPIVGAIDPAQVNVFLDSVGGALDGNEASVSRALDDLAVLVQGLGERDEAIGRLIENLEVVSRTIADRDGQIQTMLDNLVVLSQTFSDNTDLLETALVEVGQYNTDLSDVLSTNRGEIDGILQSLSNTLDTVEANLGPLETILDNIDENAAATFRSSSYGTFLNQTILCLSVTPPPCPTPIIPGLGGVTGQGSQDAVVVAPDRRRGSAAILSLVGGGGA